MFLTELLPAAIRNNPKVFQPGKDCRGKQGIDGTVKVLLALGVLCFGNSIYKELPLYQMGESTACMALMVFCHSIANDNELQSKWLHSMSRSDAEAVRKLHKEKHGINGMAFSINCMHVFSKNCPVAWQGMFQGMKGSPTIVCEAGVDYKMVLALQVWLSWNDE